MLVQPGRRNYSWVGLFVTDAVREPARLNQSRYGNFLLGSSRTHMYGHSTTGFQFDSNFDRLMHAPLSAWCLKLLINLPIWQKRAGCGWILVLSVLETYPKR